MGDRRRSGPPGGAARGARRQRGAERLRRDAVAHRGRPGTAYPLPEAPGCSPPWPGGSGWWRWSRAVRCRSWPSAWPRRARRCACSAPTGSSGSRTARCTGPPRWSRGRAGGRGGRPRPGRSSRAKPWGSRTRACRSRCTGARLPRPAAAPGSSPGRGRSAPGSSSSAGRMAVEFRPPVDIDKGVGGRAPGAGMRGGVLRR